MAFAPSSTLLRALLGACVLGAEALAGSYYREADSYSTTRDPDPPRYVGPATQSPASFLNGFKWLDVGLDYRLRYEFRDDDIRRDVEGVDEPLLHRTRLYLGVRELVDPLRFAVEIQDSHRYGSRFAKDNRDVNELEAIRAAGCDHLIFRLCWVYGARGANFMLTMQRLAREREKLRVVADQVGCPTWSRMIAETTAQALLQVRQPDDARRLSGTYHLCSSGQTSWHGFAKAIIDLMPPDTRKCREVEAITSAEYPTPTKRPAYSVMSAAKLERAFGLRLPDWHDSLRQVVEA